MASETLKIIIEAVDKASEPLGKIGGKLGKLALGFGKDVIGAGVIAGTGAIIGLGAALEYSVEQAMAAEEVQAQLEAVLKSTGGVAGVTAEYAEELAYRMSQVTRFDDEAILSGEALMLTFTNISDDVFPHAIEMAMNMSQSLEQDLNSSVIQLGKALQDPVGGLTALKKSGVNVNEEFIEMIKSIMGDSDALEKLARDANKASGALPGLHDNLAVAEQKMQEMTNAGKSSESQLMAQQAKIDELKRKIEKAEGSITRYDEAQAGLNSGMSESERLMEAQSKILAELKTEFGGSAQAAGETFAGQLDILRNNLDNVAESAGEKLMPALTTAFQTITPYIMEFAQSFADFVASDQFQEWVEKAVSWLKNDLPIAIQKASDFWNNELIPAFNEFWPILRDDVLPLLGDFDRDQRGDGEAGRGDAAAVQRRVKFQRSGRRRGDARGQHFPRRTNGDRQF